MSATALSRPVGRFAWKEYRTLRGLWVAVLGTALFFDWLLGVVLAPTTDFGTVRLCVALTAALCYAAGATAILFSVEHEEQTYDFLRGLPTTWLPIYLGKLATATVSALGLAAVLTLIGRLTSGDAPSRDSVSLSLGILGVGIFEALAWGTLWSMLLKRPLVAAVMTFFVGGLAASLAVNASGSNSIASTDPRAYVAAIPLRLAIVVAVMFVSVLRARRWFPVGAASRMSAEGFSGLAALRSQAGQVRHNTAVRAVRPHRGRMLTRLIWQSWRESWTRLLLPVAIACLCLILTFIGQRIWPQMALLGVATIFFSPVIYGALAFSADQRRDRVRFLAEHAAAPRYVWLSRHIVWFGTLAVVVLILTVLFVTMVVRSVEQRTRRYEQQMMGRQVHAYDQVREIRGLAAATASGAAVATWGILTAYALGQLSSIVLRSEILSAFLSMILAMLLAGWVSVLLLWQLSVWLFLLPLVVGLMWATWLRAPGWIEGRNSARAWVKPGLAVVAAFAFVGAALPIARLEQLSRIANPLWGLEDAVNETAESAVATTAADDEATATASMYLQAASLLQTSSPEDPLAPWSHLSTIGGPEEWPYGIDVTQIPGDQIEAFQAAVKKSDDLVEQRRQAAFKLAIEASKRPTCHFDFHLSADNFPGKHHWWNDASWINPGNTYGAVTFLQQALCAQSNYGVKEDVPFERLLAGLRLCAHMRAGQPTVIYVRQLQQQQEILERIAEWAFHANRTNEERRKALDELQKFFQQPADGYGALLADHAQIRKVILENDLPFILNESPIPTSTYLAFLANKLPWEEERALLALDLVTNQNLRSAHDLIALLANTKTRDNGNEAVRAWLRPDFERVAWETRQPAAATSYLMSMEYAARVPIAALFRQLCDTKTFENATLIRVALAMYRQDHDEYPNSLAELVPEYLNVEPLDPYAMQPFQFEPRGLDKPLIQSDFNQRLQIDAHAPFFWSVGPNNLQLQRVETVGEAADPSAAAMGESAPVGPYFIQRAREWLFGSLSSPVFVLPRQ